MKSNSEPACWRSWWRFFSFCSHLRRQRKDEAHDALANHRWLSLLRHLIEGLHAMGQSRSIWLAALASIPYLALQVIPLYAMMRGYGVDLPISAAAVVLVILRLGTIIPGPPGNIGFFNAFAVPALTCRASITRRPKDSAASCSSSSPWPLLLGRLWRCCLLE